VETFKASARELGYPAINVKNKDIKFFTVSHLCIWRVSREETEWKESEPQKRELFCGVEERKGKRGQRLGLFTIQSIQIIITFGAQSVHVY